MGATDPSSGTASVHEVVRGFGVLLKKGWKPLRTVVFASWDAEEVCRWEVRALPHIFIPLLVRIDWQHRMGRRLC